MTTNYPHHNPFTQLFKLIIISITLVFLFTMINGCASKQTQSTHTIERIIEHRMDSVKTTQINAAIVDSLVIKIAKVKTAKPECDSITQATLDQVLKQLNTSKKSGYNEAKIYYDDILHQIILILKQGETKTEHTHTKIADTDTSRAREIIKIPVKYIPWWVKYLAYLGAATLLYLAYKISRIWIKP